MQAKVSGPSLCGSKLDNSTRQTYADFSRSDLSDAEREQQLLKDKIKLLNKIKAIHVVNYFLVIFLLRYFHLFEGKYKEISVWISTPEGRSKLILGYSSQD